MIIYVKLTAKSLTIRQNDILFNSFMTFRYKKRRSIEPHLFLLFYGIVVVPDYEDISISLHQLFFKARNIHQLAGAIMHTNTMFCT